MSVTGAKGFQASGVVAGLKASGNPDLALVVADASCAVAGVFTSNRVVAAPVQVSRGVVTSGVARAVVLNSGGANACTGKPGLADAQAMAAAVADAVGCDAADVAVASTGLIGVRLPMDKLTTGITAAHAALSRDGGAAAAEAICTTDTVPKTAVRESDGVTVGGMAKGAGMLAPGLATMLCVITTDAQLDAPALQSALAGAVRTTFDRVDTDGCMSTNDTVLLLASGASGVTPEPGAFSALLEEVCADLAGQLVADAEGASKQVAVVVRNAPSEDDAVAAARAVARSALLKCALHGEDPNWGRVLAALGTTDVEFDPEAVDVDFNGVPVCSNGVAAGDPEKARAALADRHIEVAIDLHAGSAEATVLTTDLTAAYVHENSAYST